MNISVSYVNKTAPCNGSESKMNQMCESVSHRDDPPRSSDGFTTLQRSLGTFSTIKQSSTEEVWALRREGLLGKKCRSAVLMPPP